METNEIIYIIEDNIKIYGYVFKDFSLKSEKFDNYYYRLNIGFNKNNSTEIVLKVLNSVGRILLTKYIKYDAEYLKNIKDFLINFEKYV